MKQYIKKRFQFGGVILLGLVCGIISYPPVVKFIPPLFGVLENLKMNIEHCMIESKVDNPITRTMIKDYDEYERQKKADEFRKIVVEQLQNKNFIYPVVQFIGTHMMKLNSGSDVIIPNIIETTTEFLIPYVTITTSKGNLQRQLSTLKSYLGTVSHLRHALSLNKQKHIRGVLIINSNNMKGITSSDNIEVIHFDATTNKFIEKNNETLVTPLLKVE